jgi:phosphoribosylglycinamide formyltransferase-1
MTNIAIFASGNGSNAQRIAEYFAGHESIRICLILSNKSDAFVLQRAENLGIPSFVFSGKEFRETNIVPDILRKYQVDFIVLAGFLLLVPMNILSDWQGKIINIHPALLPKYGGRGMYGHHVHEAVIAAGEQESGITIHYVNASYDEGDVIFQAGCPVLPDDTSDSLAARIHGLEYAYFPEVIGRLLGGG